MIIIKNIPNVLTLIRLLLVPLFVYHFINYNHLIALSVFCLASFTDFLDGYIARKYEAISNLGKVLDPLADKMMLLAVISCLFYQKIIPTVVFYVIMISESFMIISGTYLYFKKVKVIIPSNIFGKLSTIIFTFTIIIAIVFKKTPFVYNMFFLSVLFKMIALGSYVNHFFAKNYNQTD